MSERHTDAHPAELNRTEARQGETSGHMRKVLAISIAIAVAAGIIVYLVYFPR